MALTKLQRRNRIKNRIRKIVSGTAAKPRLSVFRSNKEISAQLIDDVAGVTLDALGLHKMNQVVEHDATPAILGMVKTVNHLVSVEEIK